MNPYPPPPLSPAPLPARGNAGLWWAVGGAVVAVVLVAMLATLLMKGGSGGSSTVAGARSAASGSASTCGLPGAGSTTPIGQRVVSGPVSFPVSAAPGWTPQRYQLFAPGAQAAGLRTTVPGHKWDAHVEVGLTTFAPKVPVAEAARRIIPCIVASSRYDSYRPRLVGLTEPEAIAVDGVPAARAVGRILVSREGLAIPGDVVTVVVIGSAPQAYFESDTPIGDTALAAVAQQVFEQLKVARDV
ncbi:hypothetical protein [Tsukamurella ocularis]|uniref:hypothetical protein n=1 Tax=Tsukamurella ocularis TaxID=1970234 RepID=UPI002168E111|nr:hypothetical protein [Tsukamurella ocularis]MCS3781122.1 hypothetical protein [Tsukamurella ocularis]MCS3786946.1 hypothetical protein [Tsukamurella ocularis]MCS3850788.1 hypothetical protein [Tsukamurella ocularis]